MGREFKPSSGSRPPKSSSGGSRPVNGPRPSKPGFSSRPPKPDYKPSGGRPSKGSLKPSFGKKPQRPSQKKPNIYRMIMNIRKTSQMVGHYCTTRSRMLNPHISQQFSEVKSEFEALKNAEVKNEETVANLIQLLDRVAKLSSWNCKAGGYGNDPNEFAFDVNGIECN